MTASKAAVIVTRPWLVRLLFVAAGALATMAVSTGTAHADTNLVGDLAKQAHSVVKSTHQKVQRTPARAAAPVRRVVTPRNSSATRPVTTVHLVAKTTTPSKRVVHRSPVKKVVQLAAKPQRVAATKAPAVKLPKAVKVSQGLKPPRAVRLSKAIKLSKAVKLPKEVKPPKVVKTAPLLEPLVVPVLHVAPPVLATVPTPLKPIVSASPPAIPPLTSEVSGPIRSVPGIAPGTSTAAAPVSNGPAPNVSGVGPTSSRPGLATVAHTVVAHAVDAVDQVADGTGPVVLGSLGSLAVTVAAAAGATGTASAESAGSSGSALLECGLLGAAATSNPRFGEGPRASPWALAKHLDFAPD